MAFQSTTGHVPLEEGDGSESPHGLARIAYGFTSWAEKWFPDAFVFVVLTTLLVVILDLCVGAKPLAIADGFGSGFWSLIPFTLQMAMVAITGFVVASSPPCSKLIAKLAAVPRSNPQAVAWVAIVAMLASYLNWALSLVLGGLLVRAIARRTDIRLDYRAASGAAYLGLGCTWALGLSSSSAMLQANPLSLPKSISDISGVIPLSQTIFLWQSVVLYLVLLVVSTVVFYFATPRGKHTKTAEDLGIDVHDDEIRIKPAERPGDRLEFTPILPLLIVLLAVGYFWVEFSGKGVLETVSSLNNYNFFFLMLGLLLHKNIRSFLSAVTKAVPTAAGVIIQFPFYGAIAAMLTHVAGADGLSISHHLSEIFVSIANGDTFPLVIGIYSAILGFLVPSGGGKWIVEAPYVLQAAQDLHAHMGWAVQVYNASEALPNLINPFWMLPLLGTVKLQARDIVGFTFTQMLISAPIVLFLLWFFGETLR